MPGTKEPTRELRAGRRALEGFAGIRIMEDLHWRANYGMWALRLRLTIDVQAQSLVPPSSDWYVLIADSYPWGWIAFFPAKENGIQATFPHQSYNGPGEEDWPWREGELCLRTGLGSLGREAIDVEPFDPLRRLRWYCARAVKWLIAASRDELVKAGDPFELPHFRGARSGRNVTAFIEDTNSCSIWRSISTRVGYVDLSVVKRDPLVVLAGRFRTADDAVLLEPAVGRWIDEHRLDGVMGVWFLLDAAPVSPPRQTPATWGELRQVFRSQGLDFDSMLGSVSGRLRDGEPHLALMGFPIPQLVGGEPHLIHWQALDLPKLSTEKVSGFRNNERSYRRRDHDIVLADRRELVWLPSENWSPMRISTRGTLPQALASQHILVIGAGAFGSAVSELLVRGGCSDLVILDHDRLEIGNLTRHTLTMGELGEPKSTALVRRLNGISPHARIVGVDCDFPKVTGEAWDMLNASTVIVDCTGADNVLHLLEEYEWPSARQFFSISVGVEAKRLFLLEACGQVFPHSALRPGLNAWLAKEADEYGEKELPRDGVGCWHPLFPARADDVWMWSAAAIKHMATRCVELRPAKARLTVYEQLQENGFEGIRRTAVEELDGILVPG